MKDLYQNTSNYEELEESTDYYDGNNFNESKINFLDICSLVIFIISVGFLIETTIL
jgi:hypothetical protein